MGQLSEVQWFPEIWNICIIFHLKWIFTDFIQNCDTWHLSTQWLRFRREKCRLFFLDVLQWRQRYWDARHIDCGYECRFVSILFVPFFSFVRFIEIYDWITNHNYAFPSVDSFDSLIIYEKPIHFSVPLLLQLVSYVRMY